MLLLCGCTPRGAVCTVQSVGSLPTIAALGFLAVPAVLGDRPATMLLDTGAQGSLIVPAEAALLGLATEPGHRTVIVGVGGSSVQVRDVVVSQIRLGSRATGPVSLPVQALPGALQTLDPPVAGLLGLNVLQVFDLDIDRPGRRVGVYLRHGCAGVGPRWEVPYDRLPLRRTKEGFLVVPVRVDGVALEAMIDTGARYSVLSKAAAARLNLADAAFARDPEVRSLGVDARALKGHRHRFGEMRIGGVVMRDKELIVSEVKPPAGDMLLGDDVLREHRLWLSLPAGEAWIARGVVQSTPRRDAP